MSLAQKRQTGSGGQDRRIKEVYLFILSGSHNTASLAAKLGLSVPTVSRLVESLKKDLVRRGKRLVSVRSDEGFHYEIRDEERERRISRDPLIMTTIPARGGRRGGWKSEDRDLYEW